MFDACSTADNKTLAVGQYIAVVYDTEIPTEIVIGDGLTYWSESTNVRILLYYTDLSNADGISAVFLVTD